MAFDWFRFSSASHIVSVSLYLVKGSHKTRGIGTHLASAPNIPATRSESDNRSTAARSGSPVPAPDSLSRPQKSPNNGLHSNETHASIISGTGAQLPPDPDP